MDPRASRPVLTRPKSCQVPGCTNAPHVRRRWPTPEDRTWMCTAHTARLIRTGRADPLATFPPRTCNYPGCEKVARRAEYGTVLRRCDDHVGGQLPTPTCGMPGCDEPVTRSPDGKCRRRCETHVGQLPPDHAERCSEGKRRARSS